MPTAIFSGRPNGGGASNDGQVIEIAKGGGTITTLASFSGSNGGNPMLAAPTEDAAGDLFGTTIYGGASGDGTVFEIAKGSGKITVLAAIFNGTNGSLPYGGVVEDAAGNLFGTAYQGGTSNYGTVFEVVKGSGTITTVASFNNANGANPLGGLIEDAAGNLFGTAYQGGNWYDGSVFEIARGSSTITTLASFSGTNGENPGASLLEDASGDLFGTTGTAWGSPVNIPDRQRQRHGHHAGFVQRHQWRRPTGGAWSRMPPAISSAPQEMAVCRTPARCSRSSRAAARPLRSHHLPARTEPIRRRG